MPRYLLAHQQGPMNSEPLPPETSVLHTYLAGQSLIDIAVIYGVSPADLIAANQLSEQSILFPGYKLKIPVRAKRQDINPPAEFHTVIAGDTLHSIAEKYKIEAMSLKTINGLSDGAILFPGRVLKLIVPKIERQEAIPDNFPKHCLIHGYHKVQLGDQISRIAAFHGVSTQSVLTANNLGWNSIVSPGAKIIIPISHNALNCPDLVQLSESAKTMAQRIVTLGLENNLAEIKIISALCLEMQRSGMQSELGNKSMVDELLRRILATRAGLKTVHEVLTDAGFTDYSFGATKWEPSAWLWLHQIRSNSE